MKALKTPLAKLVLSDPKAKGQLRKFLATKSAEGDPRTSAVIEVTIEGKTVRLKPVVVPNAA